MRDNVVRFTKALSNESLKRLPYILLVFGCLLLYQGYTNGRTTRENSTDTKTLLLQVARQGEDIASLSRDNHKLQQQGIDLQKRSNDQLACITNLFIDFINSGHSLTKADAANCSVSLTGVVQPAGTSRQAASLRLSPGPIAGMSSSPSSNPTPGKPLKQFNNSQSPGSSMFNRFIYSPVTNFLKRALGVE